MVYGNMPNNGAISNLPNNAITEVPTLVDRSGLQFTHVGALPPQLIGYMNPHVTQHELFIRAAMEGRRDHVYQACMFDPLTAATLPLDQIVDMCDELIAGHAEFLPDLDAKKTLVAQSGKTFAPPTPQELRASWDAAQKAGHEDDLLDWKIIGPFKNGADAISLDFAPAFEPSLLNARPDFSADYQSGEHSAQWKPFSASKKGYVNLAKAVGPAEYAVAYAYAEVDSVHARETVLKCGSDDGIKIWVNGKPVLENDVRRDYAAGDDETAVSLQEGTKPHFGKNHQSRRQMGLRRVGSPRQLLSKNDCAAHRSHSQRARRPLL